MAIHNLELADPTCTKARFVGKPAYKLHQATPMIVFLFLSNLSSGNKPKHLDGYTTGDGKSGHDSNSNHVSGYNG